MSAVFAAVLGATAPAAAASGVTAMLHQPWSRHDSRVRMDEMSPLRPALDFVNDAGFWPVKEYFGLMVGETTKTWSTMETVISVVGLVTTFAPSLLL